MPKCLAITAPAKLHETGVAEYQAVFPLQDVRIITSLGSNDHDVKTQEVWNYQVIQVGLPGHEQ